jgi:hypothetical protein
MAATGRPALPAKTLTYEERLKDLPWKGWDWKASDPKRPATIIDWLRVDRQAAMRYLAQNRFRDLRNPSISIAVGEKATKSELLDIANGADSPWDAVYGAGKWASPDVINGLAGLMPSVSPGAAGRRQLLSRDCLRVSM